MAASALGGLMPAPPLAPVPWASPTRILLVRPGAAASSRLRFRVLATSTRNASSSSGLERFLNAVTSKGSVLWQSLGGAIGGDNHDKSKSGLAICIASLVIALSAVAPPLDAHAFVTAPPRKLQSDELATVQLFKLNTPSVVYITNLAARRDAFTLDVLEVPQGSGSGFVWDKEGHVVTNFHVIRGASDLRVTLADQSVYEADVVGFDEDKDVAVLHIDAPRDRLKPIPVGTSSDLLVGQKVYAIGNPFGLDHTLTTGVISGLRREISSAATGRPIQDVIQTDAAINPGNSGGPLLDSSGDLIGINTAIYSPSGASSGVGFSIPVDTVSGIVEQLIKYGRVTRPVLGITFAPEQSVEQLGVSGVLVLDAPPGGPAGKAGLRPTKRDGYGRLVLGDIITSINNQKISNGSDLYRVLDRCKVGDKITVEVLRGEETVKIPITLEPRA
ncbi:protease Do-like 1, chloroplastic [Selaginella moellendorffii]|nr:protease Do-like 1, chloroplastic [Selaginella moellendorffii]XP_024537889.1 protease Do-like 1, chloroplastic [Selaginella moellendorffii]|eukprot:XP_002977281.2 protease Do-like 1, chloroplastic [Selaginella moellendorffii]